MIDQNKIPAVLDAKITTSDVGTVTVREYFKRLLRTLMDQGEGFSGKRPFGNSGWEYDILPPMVKLKMIPGGLEDGDYYASDYNEYRAATILLVNAL